VDDGSLPYDPFRLVVPQRFNAINPAPFQVIIRSNCLLMMDFHAHLVHTEVIGLLGGRYDPEARQLWVETVFPCNSLSTGIQCEMDPVSETAARDAFSQYVDVLLFLNMWLMTKGQEWIYPCRLVPLAPDVCAKPIYSRH